MKMNVDGVGACKSTHVSHRMLRDVRRFCMPSFGSFDVEGHIFLDKQVDKSCYSITKENQMPGSDLA